jgi:RHS repeat-associated protein
MLLAQLMILQPVVFWHIPAVAQEPCTAPAVPLGLTEPVVPSPAVETGDIAPPSDDSEALETDPDSINDYGLLDLFGSLDFSDDTSREELLERLLAEMVSGLSAYIAQVVKHMLREMGWAYIMQRGITVNSLKVGAGIDLNLANKSSVQMDYQGSGPGALVFTRVYNSNANAAPAWTPTPMGVGWRSYWDRRVQLVSSTVMRMHRPNGTVTDLVFNGYSWVNTEPEGGVLSNISGGWRFVTRSNEIETYGYNGRLLTVSRAGHVLTLQYDYEGRLVWVLNSFGKGIKLEYDSANRVNSLVIPGGSSLTYTYDAYGNLAGVRFPDNSLRQYLYENTTYRNALTGIIDESGRRLATWGYDSAGRPNYNVYGSGINPLSITYAANQASTTDARGTVRTRTFTTIAGKRKVSSLTVGATANSAALTKQFGYDGYGNLASLSAPSGAVSTAQKDSRGRPQVESQAVGTSYAKSTYHTWHSTYNIPTQSWKAGVAINREVDAHGRITKVTRIGTDGSSQVLVQAAYNAQNLLQSVTNARGATTTFTYDAQGNRTSATNPAGQTTYFSNYDAHGRAGLVTKPNGTTASVVYDSMGRLTHRNAAGLTTSFTYDAAGRMTRATLPDGSFAHRYFNSAGFLYAVSNHKGETMHLDRDVDGKVKSRATYGPSGALVNVEYVGYDALGRVKTQTDSRGYSSTANYSADGRPNGATDQHGRTTTVSLDLLNRATGYTQGNTAAGLQKTGAPVVSSFINYDPAKGTVQSVADTAAVGTGFGFDAFNRRKVESGADAGTRLRNLNAAGDVTSFTDARGVTFNLTRDILGRVTHVIAPSGATLSYAYVPGRADSLPASMSDTSGSTSWSYDTAGRLLSKTQTIAGSYSRSINLTRDGLGRVSTMTYPSGMQVSAVYTGDAVTQLNVNGVPFISNVTYRTMSGASTGWYWRNGGQRHYRNYDNDGRTVRTSLGPRERWLGYDAAGRIVVTQDANTAGSVSSSSYYSYDTAGQLNTYSSTSGSATYNYDTNGNRLSQFTNFHNQSFSYAANSNRLLTAPSGTYTYAADGNITSDGIWTYGYDELGRLKTLYGFDGEQEDLIRSYNGQGMRNRMIRRFWYEPGTGGEGGGGDYSMTGAPGAATTAVAGAANRTGLSPKSKASALAARSSPITAANTIRTNTGAATSQPVKRSTSISSPGRSGADLAAAAPKAASTSSVSTTSTTSSGTSLRGAVQSTSSGAWGSVAQWITTDDIHYFHADSGPLLGEYNVLTGYSAETIWFNGMPVGAMINGVLYNVHSDHLSTPRSLTRTSDNVEVWRWDGEPFGNSFPSNPSNDIVIYNLRFAGQQYEAYSGLNQNWFRDYDPNTGRYLQADPIGLSGGWNRYGYVGGDPVSFVAPNGLKGGQLRLTYNPGIRAAGPQPAVPPFGGFSSSSSVSYTNSYRLFEGATDLVGAITGGTSRMHHPSVPNSIDMLMNRETAAQFNGPLRTGPQICPR